MVYINTLMIQQVLSERSWARRLTKEDHRALTPLIYAHVNPYGIFLLNMRSRLPIESAYKALDSGEKTQPPRVHLNSGSAHEVPPA